MKRSDLIISELFEKQYRKLTEHLRSSYQKQKWPMDKLPYTKEFDDMHDGFKQAFDVDVTKKDFWRLLTRLRKRGELENKTERKTTRKQKTKTDEDDLNGFGIQVN